MERLRKLVADYQAVQQFRIALGNQLAAISEKRSHLSDELASFLKAHYDSFFRREKEIDREIRAEAEHVPIIAHCAELKNVGLLSAAMVCSLIDIRKADTVAKLWRYCGYGVIDGRAERHTRGQRSHFSPFLKKKVHLISVQLIRQNSPYRRIYDAAMEYYRKNRKDWSEAHCHHAALRRVAKLFLSHLWVTWRKLEGLPVRQPYAIEVLGHSTYYKPEDFGWPEID